MGGQLVIHTDNGDVCHVKRELKRDRDRFENNDNFGQL